MEDRSSWNIDGEDDDGHDGRGSTPSSSSRKNSLTIPQRPSSDSSLSLLARYNKLLDRYPLQTKMITSFCVSAFGSALGSYLSARAKEDRARRLSKRNGKVCKDNHPSIDWIDVLSYAIHGGLINAPISHYWFEWLSANGPSSNTASVLVDQLVVQPPLLARKYCSVWFNVYLHCVSNSSSNQSFT